MAAQLCAELPLHSLTVLGLPGAIPHPPLLPPLRPLNQAVAWTSLGRQAIQAGRSGPLCPGLSRGWTRLCITDTQAARLPAPWTQGLPSVVPPPGLLSLPRPLQDVCWTLSQPLQLFLEKWPIPFLGLPQRVVGCGVTGSLLASELCGAGGWGSREGTEVWTL